MLGKIPDINRKIKPTFLIMFTAHIFKFDLKYNRDMLLKGYFGFLVLDWSS